MCSKGVAVVCVLGVTLVACQSDGYDIMDEQAPVMDESTEMTEEGWQMLGSDQWRQYNGEGLPEAWQAGEDNVLHFTGEGDGG